MLPSRQSFHFDCWAKPYYSLAQSNRLYPQIKAIFVTISWIDDRNSRLHGAGKWGILLVFSGPYLTLCQVTSDVYTRYADCRLRRRALDGDGARMQAAGRAHRADCFRKLCQPAGAGGARLGAD